MDQGPSLSPNAFNEKIDKLSPSSCARNTSCRNSHELSSPESFLDFLPTCSHELDRHAPPHRPRNLRQGSRICRWRPDRVAYARVVT